MSRTKAINEKCRDCIYDNLEPGTWREQTTACTSPDCALYPYRPLVTGMARKEAIHGPTVTNYKVT